MLTPIQLNPQWGVCESAHFRRKVDNRDACRPCVHFRLSGQSCCSPERTTTEIRLGFSLNHFNVCIVVPGWSSFIYFYLSNKANKKDNLTKESQCGKACDDILHLARGWQTITRTCANITVENVSLFSYARERVLFRPFVHLSPHALPHSQGVLRRRGCVLSASRSAPFWRHREGLAHPPATDNTWEENKVGINGASLYRPYVPLGSMSSK